MDLVACIGLAVAEGRFAVSRHARGRLRQRRIELWQVEAGVADWKVLEVRPTDLPNPSIVAAQSLPDGTGVTTIWAWAVEQNEALLVTVFFPNGADS
jgi:hypothetical protein